VKWRYDARSLTLTIRTPERSVYRPETIRVFN